MISIVYRRLPHAEGLQLPAYKSEDAAGMDLVAALPADGGGRPRPRRMGFDTDRVGD